MAWVRITAAVTGEGIDAADHWGKTSFDLITGLILHELLSSTHGRGKAASLADVAYALSNPDQKTDALWEEMQTNRHLVAGPHPVVAAAGREMLDWEVRERGNVLSSAKTCLLLFKDPIVAENTKHCEFRLLDLMNHQRPVSLYIVTRGADKERLRPAVCPAAEDGDARATRPMSRAPPSGFPRWSAIRPLRRRM